ncbi:F0F1 ATP synthase subunit alpha, partial [Arthrospira platensis SPKY1]|nr:F0F1 ATP synthase subunit alpha [Arthrospira platensis SPKY1]
MSSILSQIESEIAKFDTGVVQTNTGRIVSIADGVAKLEGLSGVMSNEMIDFGDDVFGLALNLEEGEVGCIVLGDYSRLKEGDSAQTTGKLLSVPVGKGLLGRVVDAIGQPVDGKGPISSEQSYPVEQIAPGIIPRKSVDQPLQT